MPFEAVTPAAEPTQNANAEGAAPETNPVDTTPKNPSLLDEGGIAEQEAKEVATGEQSILDKAAADAKQAEITDLKDKIAKSTDEAEKKALQEKLGKLEPVKKEEAKPAVPEKYEFKAPEGMKLDQAMVDKFTPIAKEMGLSQEKAQKLVDLYADAMKASEASVKAVYEKFLSDSKAETIKSLGAEWRQEISFAAKTRDRLLSPETIEELNNAGLSNRISLIRDLIKIGKMISEDTLVSGGSGDANAGKTYADQMYPNQGK